MPTGKLTSFGLKAVDSDKWDGNIREAIAVAGKDGQKLVLLYNAVVAKAAVDDQVTNSATANYNGGADSEAATTVVKLGFFTMKKIFATKSSGEFPKGKRHKRNPSFISLAFLFCFDIIYGITFNLGQKKAGNLFRFPA